MKNSPISWFARDRRFLFALVILVSYRRHSERHFVKNHTLSLSSFLLLFFTEAYVRNNTAVEKTFRLIRNEMRSLRASIFLRILPSLFPSPRVFPRAKKASGDILIDRLGFPSRVQINIQNRWSIEHFAQIEQEIWLTVHASLAASSHLHLFIRSFRNDNARLISNYNAQTTIRTFVNKHTSFALQPRPLQHFPNIFSLSRLEENNSAEDKIKGDEQANILWAGIATTAAATSSQCRPFTHTHTLLQLCICLTLASLFTRTPLRVCFPILKITTRFS